MPDNITLALLLVGVVWLGDFFWHITKHCWTVYKNKQRGPGSAEE